jgi:hypothetical protein
MSYNNSTNEVQLNKKSLTSKFSAFTEKVLKILPKTTESGRVFTPLVLFSKLIREGVVQTVETIRKDMKQ